jgi:hypothetical protein
MFKMNQQSSILLDKVSSVCFSMMKKQHHSSVKTFALARALDA